MNRKITEDEAFRAGTDLFNRGEYFAAHEIWEEIWLAAGGETRRFLQGLIQWALSLYHFQRGNLKGARKLFESGDLLLKPFNPEFQGVSLSPLRNDMVICLQELFQCPVELLAGFEDAEKNVRFEILPRERPVISIRF
ncbi:MAG: DUF309 domain-containing protein [Desulfuromonadaceae bacterium]|nr:DUF309 domain-containing protein [Desulfuromonadaceae bacterium]